MDVMSAQQDGFVTFAETKVIYYLRMKTLVKLVVVVMKVCSLSIRNLTV